MRDPLAQHPAVLDTRSLLSHQRQMANHVEGSDIARKYQQTLLAFPQCLDDLLHTPAQLTHFRRPFDCLEHLFRQFLAGKGRGDGRNGIWRDVELGLK